MTTSRFPLIGIALAALFLAIPASPAVARKVIGPPDPIPSWSYNPGGGFGGTNQLIITGTAGDDTIILGTDQPISGYGNITINGLNTGIPLFGNPLDITVYGDPPDGSGRGGDDTIDLSAWTIGSLIFNGGAYVLGASVHVFAGPGDDTLIAGNVFPAQPTGYNLVGGPGRDRITGGDGNDVIYGGGPDAKDVLDGGAGMNAGFYTLPGPSGHEKWTVKHARNIVSFAGIAGP
jgi:hypothetical protein